MIKGERYRVIIEATYEGESNGSWYLVSDDRTVSIQIHPSMVRGTDWQQTPDQAADLYERAMEAS